MRSRFVRGSMTAPQHMRTPGVRPFKISDIGKEFSTYAWLEPGLSPLSVWQDHTGSAAVTATNQVVGLLWDGSSGEGLGPNLVTNGDISNGTTGWTATNSTLTAVSGELVVTGNIGAGYPDARLGFSAVSGKAYLVSGTYRRGTSANQVSAVIKIGSNVTPLYNSSSATNVNFSFLFTSASTATAQVTIFENAPSSAGGTVICDNISVREVLSNNAIQATTANKPTLQAGSSGNLALRHDTTDGLTFTAATPGFSGALGDELVTNGDFSADTWWTKAAGVTITGGVCTFTGVSTSSGLSRASLLTVGATYVVTWTITSITAASLRLVIGGTVGTTRSTAGTYSETIVCGATTALRIDSVAGPTTAVIDNVSVREVPSLASLYYATPSGVTQTHGLPIYSTYDLPGKPGSGTADVYGWILTPGRPSASLEANIIKYLARRAGL